MNYIKKAFFLLVVAFSFCKSFAQPIEVTIAPGIQVERRDINEIIDLWKDYLHKNPQSNDENPYWNKGEKSKYKVCDLLRTEGFFNPSLYSLGFKNIILYIQDLGDKYLIKSMFYHIDKDKNFLPFATTNVYARKENEGYRLYNFLPEATMGWKEQKVGIIHYYYPNEYTFNAEKGKQANEFANKVMKMFKISNLDTISYYIAPDCEEVHTIKGFDFVVGMGSKTNLCAFYDKENNIVYTTYTGGEFHRHELLHIINKKYKETHGLLLSGLSVYTNSENAHLGNPFIFHIKNITANILDRDKNFNFLELESLSSINAETEVFYFVGALLIETALEKGGNELMLKLFEKGKTEEDILQFFKEELGYDKDQLNQKIKEKCYRISKEKTHRFLLNFD